MNDPDLFILIPVHGPSLKLQRLLFSLQSALDSSQYFHSPYLLISNSYVGQSLDLSVLNIPYSIVNVSMDSYWSLSVQTLYKYYLQLGFNTPVLLMNHDTVISSNCIDNLLLYSKSFTHYALHASMYYLSDPTSIWWNNSFISWRTIPQALNNQSTIFTKSSSLMGQCLLLSPSLVRPDFLFPNIVPHYYADSIQTTLMRRKFSARVGVVNNAICYSDQSDNADKQSLFRNKSIIEYFKYCFFSPKSDRLLKARFFSTIIENDNIFFGIFFGFLLVLLTVLKSIASYFFY